MPQGDNRYPHDIFSARNILYNYSIPNNNNNNNNNNNTNDTQIILSQTNPDDNESKDNNTSIPGTDGKYNSVATCYKCNKKAH